MRWQQEFSTDIKFGAGTESNIEDRGEGNLSVDDVSGSSDILGGSTRAADFRLMSKIRGFDKRTMLISDLLFGYLAAIRSLQKH